MVYYRPVVHPFTGTQVGRGTDRSSGGRMIIGYLLSMMMLTCADSQWLLEGVNNSTIMTEETRVWLTKEILKDTPEDCHPDAND